MIGVVLDYARHGADAIRLDAIGFLWKEPSTPSIHLPQTHAIIQLMRACLDVSYLGSSGEREAQAVYQFSLPPLVLHAALTGTTRRTGMNRTVNRRRFDVDALEREMDRADSREQRLWSALSGAIEARKRHPAFHPDAAMRVMDLPEGLVGIERESESGEAARCIVNLGRGAHRWRGMGEGGWIADRSAIGITRRLVELPRLSTSEVTARGV